MTELLSVDEAVSRIFEQLSKLENETIELENSLGRILAEDIISEINLPPFDNSSMDGFAIKAADSQAATRDNPSSLKVVMDIPAGFYPQQAINQAEAARIMTGAAIPEGADAVIPVEDTDADFTKELADTVKLYGSVPIGASIRKAGENIYTGQKVLEAGRRIKSAEIGILASLGQAKVQIKQQARVAIIGSGDELTSLDMPLTAGKIYDSNSYTLAAMLAEDGAIPIRLQAAKDSPEAIRAMFKEAIAHKPDMIISSAGVSVGAADYVRDIMAEFGSIDFWRINIRPGKPLAFGKIDNIPFFGLPGNPVSAMVTYTVFVRPSLMKMSDSSDKPRQLLVKIGEAMKSDGRRTYARVRLVQEDGDLVAYETGTQSSGAHLSMLLADGLLIIPEGVKDIKQGEQLEVLLLS